MKGKIFLGVFAVLYTIFACTKDKTLEPDPIDPNCPTTISFASDVKPLIDVNCVTSGCHDASGAGGYNFSTYSAVAANGELIVNVISWDTGFSPMPQGGDKLPDSLIQKIKCWVKQGKLDN